MKTTGASKRVFKQVLYLNKKAFQGHLNKDLTFGIPKTERNSPFTIIPNSLYNDFDRSAYVRHKLTFPIKVPLKKRKFEVTNEHERYAPMPLDIPDYNVNSGNEILLSLREF